MRSEFARWAEQRALKDEKMVFLSTDLGFRSFERLRDSMGQRFVNGGVAEQNLMSVAAGLARVGYHPIVYSIAPFAVFRPFEQLRVDVALHAMNVKVVGNGGGYGYGTMGSTHHALEDVAVVGALPGVRCLVPCCDEDVWSAADEMVSSSGPVYLRLGLGRLPAGFSSGEFAAVRRVGPLSLRGVTIAVLGPMLLNLELAILEQGLNADVFVFGELPVRNWDLSFFESLKATGRLLVIEEHCARGGLGEWLARELLLRGLSPRMVHLFARGYPEGLAGSQAYHQKVSGLDAESLVRAIREMESLG